MLIKVKLIEVHPDKCTGCEVCEMACSFHHEQEFSVTKSRIKVLRPSDSFDWDWPLLCIQCAEAPCIESCSVGALYRDESTGVVVVDDICNGCSECLTACPLQALTLDEEKTVIFKCDLCDGDPECVKWCNEGVLTLEKVNLDSLSRQAFVSESSKKLHSAG